MKTLKEVAVGQTVTVKKLSGASPVKRRIMARSREGLWIWESQKAWRFM